MPAWLSGPQTSLLLDWVGWLLMSGPVWAWLYERLSMPLQTRAFRAIRRRDAAFRFQLSLSARHRVHVAEFTGIPLFQLNWRDVDDRFEVHQVIRKQIRTGEASPDDVERWRKWEAIESRYATSFTRTSFVYFRYGVLSSVFVGALEIAQRLLVGRVGAVLFGVGFILWNASKVISLLALR